ncbi:MULTISPECIES: DNA/RNA non-specific endonuclease [unclassified Oceanispirochaeta]|uniref:DNA/RNA non-specific endonuclease n=1 Tax=unclassified Oceanispirochaeta TaxID=2635722 RepID=UPI000E0945AD|nr:MULTISPECIES: DNA/RNA non-specific endonuclease [unclassified Oceanispirochaeta]MBF9015885.1 DNA/RNA non-specific endonuclease [Oceanispirochaeta sp. M2]NPD72348.1 DNA/RNA non-specific endonuclease [Oceanispirochaeta sp. M1]RDG32118.1 DNA/RNA non-specific endonuclease [Oceanispirochaeta sp. M1]
MNWKISTFLLLITGGFLSAQSQSLEIPFVTNPDAVVEREFYTLQYNEAFEQADWVAYELTLEEVEGQVDRKDAFRSDPEVSTASASLKDYKGSGYDRGHLAPAADMKMTAQSMADSFYMSNMSPQSPSLNRGIWKELEGKVRKWAVENKAVYIVTGPVLTEDSYPVIGPNRVAVPDYYYKVILDYREPELKGIAFILPNRRREGDLEEFALTIDEAEEATGLDFFPLLPDDAEAEIESTLNLSLWGF